MAPLLEIRNLCKRYGGFTAVDDVTFEVAPGEIVGLLGPNGAGKTTTIRMLMGILQATSGSARIGGLDCFRERAQNMRRTGYLPDEPSFYDYLRGSEILRFVAGMHGLAHAAADARSAALAERFRLDDDLEEFAANYSKGMKKKLALICALLHEPELLILDEPTNGLDPHSTRALHELMKAEAARGTAVLFSTHLLDQAERLCHRVAILNGGRIAACGRFADLRESLMPGGGSLEDVFFRLTGDAPPRGDP